MRLLQKILLVGASVAVASFTSSCSTPITAYQDSTPELDIQRYFDGPVTAWGMVQDYNQQVTRRFCVEMQGTWKKNIGTLAETFYFNDGEISYRDWQLTRHESGEYSGTADDVIGIAQGQQQGFALQWRYQLSVKIDSENYQFDLDDWMYRIDDYRVFNRTKMNKFGITVAEITLFFDKQLPLRTCNRN
jgi:hypothetical protein